MLALTLGGCWRGNPPAVELAATRTPVDAALSAVAVKTECGWGSGVLLDSTHVLTAHHVIDCDHDPKKVTLAKSVQVETVDGKIYVAAYDALDTERDLARLRLPSAIGDVRPLSVARTLGRGQIVCAVTAVPSRDISCGLVANVPAPRNEGDIAFSAQIWFGNSGSALYNTDGALIAIVVSTYFCDKADEMLWETLEIRPARMCGARASSVEGPVLL
jgi:S1-C subfamily serine protease